MTVYEDAASGVSEYKGIMDVTVSGSTVTVTAAWRRDSYGYSSFSSNARWTITIDGTTWTDTFSFSASAGGSISRQNLATRSKNVGFQGATSVYVKVDFDVSPGVASISRSVDVSTTPGTPNPPVLSSPAPGKVSMSWSAPASNGSAITGYRVWYWVNGVWNAVNTTDRSYLFTVTPGATFTAQVMAQNANGYGDLSATRSITVMEPVPNAPSGLSVARVSDAQQTLTWTRNSTYTSVVIQRSTNDGSWQQVGVASGNAYTFTDKTTSGNRKYVYRVAGVNGGGQSAWSNSATVYTSPSAPTGISATRSGSDIRVSAASVPPYATTFDVRDGGTTVGTGVSLPWTHVAPDPGVPHTYTVRGVVAGVAGAWSSPSNTVQLIAPPNAPGALVPNGAVWPSDTDVVFQWAHNPVDSSAQSSFELQWRLDGGAWTTVTGTTDQSVTVTVGVGSVEWQVRTKGADPSFSPWSAVASFTIIDRPGVAVVQPETEWDASILVAQWSWFQAQGRPQSAWQFQLLDALNTVVESRTGSGATAALELNTRLTEGVWTVQVRGATGDVWSLWGTQTFTVVFDPPGEPMLTGLWDESQGGVGLAVAGEEFGVAVLDGGAWYAEVGV